MKKIVFILFIVITAESLFAQGGGRQGGDRPSNGVVSGNIVDDSGKPIEYASVALFSKRDSSVVAGSMSNSKGEFKLSGLKLGVYSLRIKFLGFKAKVISPIYLMPKGRGRAGKGQGIIQTFKDIKLVNSDVSIDDVNIVADKSHVQYKLDKKVVNVSQDVNAEGGSAVDVLENTPSITVDIDGNVQLRGSSSFTVLIDGKPTVLDAAEALEQIPAGLIENIEIITNPSAKFDPDGAAGIINIVMKKKTKLGLNGLIQASAGTGEKYSANAAFSYMIGKFNVFAGFDYQNDKRFGSAKSDLTTTNNGNQYHSDFFGDRNRTRKGLGVKAGVDYFINEKNTLSISARYKNRESIRHNNSFYHDYMINNYDTYYNLQTNSGNDGGSYGINADYSLKLKPNQSLQSSFHYSNREGSGVDNYFKYNTDANWNIADNTPILNKNDEDGPRQKIRYKLDFESPIGEKGFLEAGYQFRYDIDNEQFKYKSYDNTSSQWIVDKSRENETDYTKHIQALYLTYASNIVGFDYKLGLRTEYMDRTLNQLINKETYNINRFDFFPSVYVSRAIGKTMQLQINYSRRINRPGGRQLDPHPDYSNPKSIRKGNPYLNPEYVDSYEFNFQKQFNKSFIFLETYYRRTNDLITRVNLSLSGDTIIRTYGNLNYNNTYGVELGANINMYKWWRFDASVNAYYFNIVGNVNDESVDKEAFSWRLRFNNTFSIKKKTKIQLTAYYSAPSTTAQGHREGFLYSNLAIRHSFFDNKLSLTAKIRDVLCAQKYQFTTDTEAIYSISEFKREGPVYMLTLSYRINNYKQKRERNSERDEENTDIEID